MTKTYTLTEKQLAKIIENAISEAVSEASNAPKTDENKPKKPKYDAALLDSNRVITMEKRAILRFLKSNIDVTTYRQGTWIWIKAVAISGYSEEFKNVKLPDGWKYSKKRGQWFRDFS